MEGPLDLNTHLVRHPAATFYLRVAGDSMSPAVQPGALLVVDHALEPADGSIVVAVVDAELTLKRLRLSGGRVLLAADNGGYPPIRIAGDARLEIWGVVVAAINIFV
ncbi:LexA family protein [Gloeobacter morelensis]|uniref:LexA family protein n=1 Tax=Gloeobacter morelensis TaxID=2907343 RepID=UPI001E50EA3A|nr:S24 family peptidase [Gloeobacter morelensis]UFP97252.1 S24 family peptidase [Gloeobacter morelensis MG652769]